MVAAAAQVSHLMRDGATRQRVGLITQRFSVQIRIPLPSPRLNENLRAKRSACNKLAFWYHPVMICTICGLLKAQDDPRGWCVRCTLGNRGDVDDGAPGIGDNDHEDRNSISSRPYVYVGVDINGNG